MTDNQLEQIENMTDGNWHVSNSVDTEGVIERAAQRENQTVVEIENRLLAGETLLYMDAWDAKIRLMVPKQAPKQQMQQKPAKLCDCGHRSYQSMSTSNGSSCPDCYDRMSDC